VIVKVNNRKKQSLMSPERGGVELAIKHAMKQPANKGYSHAV
jgi:hypothetical protein